MSTEADDERIGTIMWSLAVGRRLLDRSGRSSGPAERLPLLAEGIQQLADPKVGLGGVPHLHVTVQAIVIAPADPVAIDVSGGYQVGDDSLCRSFSDSDHLRDIADSDLLIASDAQERLGVV